MSPLNQAPGVFGPRRWEVSRRTVTSRTTSLIAISLEGLFTLLEKPGHGQTRRIAGMGAGGPYRQAATAHSPGRS